MRHLITAITFLFVVVLSKHSMAGDPIAGEKRYMQSCFNCHGPAGKRQLAIQRFLVKKFLMLLQC